MTSTTAKPVTPQKVHAVLRKGGLPKHVRNSISPGYRVGDFGRADIRVVYYASGRYDHDEPLARLAETLRAAGIACEIKEDYITIPRLPAPAAEVDPR